jgi:iron complex outermembrane receptor protein
VDQGTLPLNSAAGQFVNNELGGRFTLGPEEATNISIGAGFEIGSVSLTVDYFNIEVDDRIAITDQQDFRGLLAGVAARSGVGLVQLSDDASTSQILNALNAAGVINAADFAGSEDLVSFGFFANDFDTKTQGVDIVASTPIELGSGSTILSLALNYTDTEVTRRGNLSTTRLRQLEENLPNWKGNMSIRHTTDKWRALARVNYHSNYFEPHLDDGTLPIDASSEFTVDVEYGYNVSEKIEVVVGAANVFDSFPDENPFSGVAGSRYPATAPFGFQGGQYYVRAKYDF